MELDYLHPLRYDDRFIVSVALERLSRVRLGFQQAIRRLEDGKPILNAKVIVTAINEAGRPFFPSELEVLIEKAIL